MISHQEAAARFQGLQTDRHWSVDAATARPPATEPGLACYLEGTGQHGVHLGGRQRSQGEDQQDSVHTCSARTQISNSCVHNIGPSQQS